MRPRRGVRERPISSSVETAVRRRSQMPGRIKTGRRKSNSDRRPNPKNSKKKKIRKKKKETRPFRQVFDSDIVSRNAVLDRDYIIVGIIVIIIKWHGFPAYLGGINAAVTMRIEKKRKKNTTRKKNNLMVIIIML